MNPNTRIEIIDGHEIKVHFESNINTFEKDMNELFNWCEKMIAVERSIMDEPDPFRY